MERVLERPSSRECVGTLHRANRPLENLELLEEIRKCQSITRVGFGEWVETGV